MDTLLKMIISADSLRHNIRLLKSLVEPGCKFCAVVKADCYGHGLNLLYEVIAQHADVLAVARPTEAIQLRQLGYSGTILLFSTPCAFDNETINELAEHDITMTIALAADLLKLQSALKKTVNAHLKIDTGMGRSGINFNLADNILQEIDGCDKIKLAGIYTHFACADSSCKESAKTQLQNFRSVADRFKNIDGFLIHAANSAGTIDLPESHFNMVRCGISMYGYQASEQMHNKVQLKPIMRLTAPLMQVKKVSANSKCGYGLTWQFDRDTTVGIVPIGYGDGYLRCLSNKSVVKVKGVLAPVRGRVSMDQIIVDLGGVPNPQPGMEVEIISDDSDSPNSVESLARLADTIPYEITCQLNNNNRINKILIN